VSIVVLLIAALLAVVLLEANYEARVSVRAADNGLRSRQALWCAEGGLSIAMAVLGQTDDIRSDEATTKLLSGKVQMRVGEGECSVSVAQEDGKINVNLLKAGVSIVRQRVDQMLELIDVLNRHYGEKSPIGYGIVPAIIDWIDTDDTVTVLPFVKRENQGAEKEHYQEKTPPYKCKNGPLDTVSELLLVKGMTQEIFEGRPGDERADIKAIAGMGSLVTVYGDGKIDINDAPAEVLESLSGKIDAAVAQSIISHREQTPFEQTRDLLKVPGVTPAVYGRIEPLITAGADTKHYRVTATGVVKGFTRCVVAVVRRDKDGSVTVLLREEP